MPHITLIEAQQHLPEIIAGLTPGETIQIFQDDRPIARLMLETPTLRKPRKPGSAIGTFTIVSDDDEHLQDFSDYMPLTSSIGF
jgi:antitoxin (DNA-binding transcriptional repressor) of toxin-antitoxin stability system